MAYQIDRLMCFACGFCEAVCPCSAIHKRKDYYIIYEQDCMWDCKSCIEICPNEAIHIDEDGPYSFLANWK